MKKFLYLASAATLALASCSDDLGIKAPGSDAAAGDGAITATYIVGGEETETRTTLYNYTYLWNLGDQIGVLGAIKELNVVNEPFVYNSVESAAKGNFKGNVTLLPNEGYVGYYPWTATSDLGIKYYAPTSDGTELQSFTLSNSSIQNFNAEAAKSTWSDQRANGSFSNNAAPAVAYAKANSNGQLEFTFKPVASYLVFPVTATEDFTITSVTLTVGNQILVKDCTVTIPQGGTVPTASWSTGASASETAAGGDGKSIELVVSGNGVNVGPGLDPVNFWFVVPSGVQLANQAVSLKIATTNSDYPTVTLSRSLDENWVDSTEGEGVTVANNTVWLWNNGGYFTINPGDYYSITTPAQFLEYAYIASTGINAAYATWSALSDYSMTDFPSMVYSPDPTNKPYYGSLQQYVLAQGSLNGLKLREAVLSTNLNVSPAALQEYLAAQSMTDVVKQGTYYKNVYANYAFNNIPLQPIGGNASYSISGADGKEITLSGLVSAGPLFTATTTIPGTVQNLTLQNCSVKNDNDPETTYSPFLAGQPWGDLTFDTVTVGTGCNVNGKTDAASNVGLYDDIYNTWMATLGVDNNVFDIYAPTLNYNEVSVDFFDGYTFDFTAIKGAGPQNFVNIVNNPDGTAVTKALFVVQDRTMAGYLIQNGKVTRNGETFSVISMGADGETPEWSYWTGGQLVSSTPTKGLNTAEYLYYKISNTASADLEFDMNINLDMMSSFENTEGETETMYWYAIGNVDYPITINTSETGNVIANVYMNGLKGSEHGSTTATPSTILAPLGYSSIIPELLNIINVEVSVPNTANNYVAAVSATVGAGDESNVKVQNLKVTADENATFVNGSIGGLYSFLTQSTLGYVGSECSYSNANNLSDFTAGIIAGYLELNLQPNSVVTIPSNVGKGEEFGTVKVIFTPTSTGNSAWLQLNCSPASAIATSNSWKNWTLLCSAASTTVYITVNSNPQWLNIAASTATAGYYKVTPNQELGTPIPAQGTKYSY